MELSATKPIYLQIKDYYENLIDSGILHEGEEMPSVREIAILYHINPNTVQRAMSLMVDDGYLQNIPKKGFYVNKVEKNNKKIIRNKLEELYSLGISKKEILEELGGEDK